MDVHRANINGCLRCVLRERLYEESHLHNHDRSRSYV